MSLLLGAVNLNGASGEYLHASEPKCLPRKRSLHLYQQIEVQIKWITLIETNHFFFYNNFLSIESYQEESHPFNIKPYMLNVALQHS